MLWDPLFMVTLMSLINNNWETLFPCFLSVINFFFYFLINLSHKSLLNDTSLSFFNSLLKHTPQVLMMKPTIICDRLSNNLMLLCSKKRPNKVAQSNRCSRALRVCRVKDNPSTHGKVICHTHQDFSVCCRQSLILCPMELV